MADKQTDWLNNFFEKNSWGILVAVLGLAGIFGAFRSEVTANTDNIKTFKEAMVEVVQLQKDIIELQTNQENDADDIKEIKDDVKELLLR